MIELKGKYNKDCKVFIDDVESEAIDMIKQILNHEISEGVPIRIMPDTHLGKGIVIGFTMPMSGMVNPNYIGVDIGCSVTSYKLNNRFKKSDLPEVDKKIRAAIPLGMEIHNNQKANYWWLESFIETLNENVQQFQQEWNKRFVDDKQLIKIDQEYINELCKKVAIGEKTFYNSVGTLGGGNHFIEIGESSNDGAHYLTIHSGSRNFGLKVCNYHAKKMDCVKDLPTEYYQKFDDITQNTHPKSDIPAKLRELNIKYKAAKKEYLLQGDDMYEYLLDMIVAQTYAEYNHIAMADLMFKLLGDDWKSEEKIHSMHNFIDTHDWIIRKGAIRAYEGEKMIIPFNMRDGLLICEGRSNADWNCSAPHGAGRILARNQAKKKLDMAEFEKEMHGIYSSSVCNETLDESPMAYKDKDVIIDAITDTAIIRDTIKPILNIKAMN